MMDTGWVVVPSEGAQPCAACGLRLESADGYRAHVREPCHLHNVKRKLAGLEPVGAAEWSARQAEPEPERRKGCSHLKHPHGRARRAPKGAVPAGTSEHQCLFDSSWFATEEACLAYMSTHYSFFPPCVLERGLLPFLRSYLRSEHSCFACGHRFGDADACRQHMVDKGHTRIGEELEEALKVFTPLEEGDDWQVLKTETASRVSPSGDLCLPGGRVATAREFAYVYKQRLATSPSTAVVLAAGEGVQRGGQGSQALVPTWAHVPGSSRGCERHRFTGITAKGIHRSGLASGR